jgi:cytochrome c-type biogenesis protein CcmH
VIRQVIRLLGIIFLVSAVWTSPSYAVNPEEMLADPEMEENARAVSRHLRCVVCQNQSIDDSDAQLARDMRVLVRERIMAGDTNREVLDYMVSRYGNYVLLKPPFEASTYVLWIGPAVIFFLGLVAVGVFMYQRRPQVVPITSSNRTSETPRLTEEEQKKLDKLLGKDN